MNHRPWLLVGLSFAVALALATPARAIEEGGAPGANHPADVAGGAEQPRLPGMGPLSRLTRGVCNIVISPLEIPATMLRAAGEHNAVYGILAGGAEGLGNGIVRLGAGALEVVTFPLPSDVLPIYNKKLGERALPPLRPPSDITRP